MKTSDRPIINIYCDESCHLENDGHSIMALGAILCPNEKKADMFVGLEEIKRKHKLIPKVKNIHDPDKQNRAIFELKWNKVSKRKASYYKEVIDFFFEHDELGFRGLVVPNKKGLDHEKYGRNHNSFYYVMYFDLLKVLLYPNAAHNIYLDIKDTKSNSKVEELQEVLRNAKYDYNREIIKKVQQVRSHEIELIQLADFFTGALSYIHCNHKTSATKLALIEYIRERSGYSLLQSTLLNEKKFNLLLWISPPPTPSLS